ncbi:MAG TPA: FkbM family methyltransferase, partial [Patescibacteria group bacterium]|nr:FkbM family methyltransferase [Patescibacteria group bacterium]
MIYQNPNDCMGNRSTFEKFSVALGILKNPWMLLLDKLGLVKTPHYTTRTGVNFITRGKTTDINDAVVVLSGKEYPSELLGLDKIVAIGQTPVVLDCGGHIGSFSMYIKSHWPQAKIVVMEPVPANLKLLAENIKLNELQNITVVPFAIYGQSGRFYIDLSGKQFDAVSVTTEKPQHENYVTIDALTFAEVVSQQNLQKIDLMKL